MDTRHSVRSVRGSLTDRVIHREVTRLQREGAPLRSDIGMRPRPLPADLGASFHVRDADLLGIPRRRLRARDLHAPFPGVRCVGEETPLDILEMCRAYLPRITGGQFFSHTTAAMLWGMPLPLTPRGPIHVSASPPAREPRTRNVVGHRLRMPEDGLTLIDDFPVPTRAETWGQLGEVLRRDDLVAAGDWIVGRGDPILDLVDVAGRARRRGAIALREAVELVRVGAESPKETEVRLILVRAGLPEPELNWTLRSATGAFIARLDMAYPHHRVAVEYDGRQHAEGEQFVRDADRWRAISDEGWTLIRVLSHHLASPARHIVEPVRRALRAAPSR